MLIKKIIKKLQFIKMGKFKKILFILTNKEKKHSLFLLVMVLIMAFLEMVGVASIMPFMSVLTNPDVVGQNNLLNSFYKSSIIFGIKDKEEFLFLGIIVMLMLVLSLIFKAITLIFKLDLAQSVNIDYLKLLLKII